MTHGEQTKWIAQTNLTCAECGEVIKVGHPYAWRERIAGITVHLERVHPECKGAIDGEKCNYRNQPL